MGRGRAKAKQTKVARQLKYGTGGTDLARLQAELAADRGDLGDIADLDEDDELEDETDETEETDEFDEEYLEQDEPAAH